MTKIKIAKNVSKASVAVSFALVCILTPVVAADAAWGVTGFWPFGLLAGIVQIKLMSDARKKVAAMELYERIGRDALASNPSMSDEELAHLIISKTSEPDRGTIR